MRKGAVGAYVLLSNQTVTGYISLTYSERLNTIREMFASQIADILASPSSANRGGGAQILGRVEDVRRQIEADPSVIENLGGWFHSIMESVP